MGMSPAVYWRIQMAKVKVPDIKEIAKLLGYRFKKSDEIYGLRGWRLRMNDGVYVEVGHSDRRWRSKIYVSFESTGSEIRKPMRRRYYVTPDNYRGDWPTDWKPRPLTDDEKKWIKYKFEEVQRHQQMINDDRLTKEHHLQMTDKRKKSLEAKLDKKGLLYDVDRIEFDHDINTMQIDLKRMSQQKVMLLTESVHQLLDGMGLLVEED
jgi:hypothetical protein